MLTRCPDCQKLYPQHHGECRNCKTNPPLARAVDPAPSRTQDKPSLRPRIGSLRAEDPATSPSVVESPAAAEAAYPEFSFAETQLDLTGKKEEKSLTLWNAKDGGICAACSTFNPASNPFCGSCGSMLLRTEHVEVVIAYPLQQIKGLLTTFVQKLAALNIKTTEDLLRIGINPKNRQMLATKTGMSERSLLRLVHTADFCRIPSVDPEKAAMLELIAVPSMEALLKSKPEVIHQKIQQSKMAINKQGILVLPTKNQVSQWFEEAQQLTLLKIL